MKKKDTKKNKKGMNLDEYIKFLQSLEATEKKNLQQERK